MFSILTPLMLSYCKEHRCFEFVIYDLIKFYFVFKARKATRSQTYPKCRRKALSIYITYSRCRINQYFFFNFDFYKAFKQHRYINNWKQREAVNLNLFFVYL